MTKNSESLRPLNILESGPPRDIDSEECLLGSIIRDQDRLDDVVSLVRADDFFMASHRAIFETMLEIHKSGKRFDEKILLASFKKHGILDDVGGEEHFTAVINSVPTPANAVYYAELVRDYALLRSLDQAGREAIVEARSGDDEPRERLSKFEAKVFRMLERHLGRNVANVGDVLHEAMALIDERIAKGRMAGMSVGFDRLDRTMGGMRPGELIVIAARPGVGKSALAANIAAHVALELHRGALIVSLEMTRHEFADRMISSLAEVDSENLKSGNLTADERTRIGSAVALVGSAPMFIDDSPTRNMTEIAAIARRLKRTDDLSLVVIDYLQLIEPDSRREPREQQVAVISRRLKQLSRELMVPVICLAQLNRQLEQGTDHTPRLSHLRECVAGDTRLIDANTGQRVRVDDLKAGTTVLSLNADQKVVKSKVSDVWKTGRRRALIVRTKSGRSITATENHPLLGVNGWEEIGRLSRGDAIAVAFRMPTDSTANQDTLDKCRLLGYMAGNGSAQEHRTLGLIVPDPGAFRDASHIITRYWPEVRIKLRANGYNDAWISRTNENGHGWPGGNPLINWLKEVGFHGVRDDNKRVPGFVFSGGSDGAAEFLSGLLATDGCVKFANRRPSVQFDTTSIGLAEDTAAMCARIGVFASVSGPRWNDKSTKPIYRVSVSKDADNIRRFATAVRAAGIRGRKLRRAGVIASSTETRASAFALPADVSLHASSVATWRHQGRRISRRRCAELATESGDQELATWCGSDVIWDEIVSITEAGEVDVFDLRLPETGCFLVDNGIVAHNSGAIEQDADVVLMIHREDMYRTPDEWDNTAKLIVAKNRNGKCGRMEVVWKGNFTRFEDPESRAKFTEGGEF